jgi:hypothetical protein
MSSDEEKAFRAVERLGAVNILTIYACRVSPDIVRRLVARGILETIWR